MRAFVVIVTDEFDCGYYDKDDIKSMLTLNNRWEDSLEGSVIVEEVEIPQGPEIIKFEFPKLELQEAIK